MRERERGGGGVGGEEADPRAVNFPSSIIYPLVLPNFKFYSIFNILILNFVQKVENFGPFCCLKAAQSMPKQGDHGN